MDYDFFGENEEGGLGSLAQIFTLVMESIRDKEITIEDGLGILCDMVRPGHSENSHDIKPMFVGAVCAFGFPELVQEFGAIWLNTLPWGIGFHIQVRPGFELKNCTPDAQRAVIEAFAIVLRLGGLEAKVTDDNQLLIRTPQGQDQQMSTDDIIGQFRQQIDEALGPDAPEDPPNRWKL